MFHQDVVLTLIKERMEKAQANGSTTTGFLIDGYPRELDQGIQFETDVISICFFFLNIKYKNCKDKLRLKLN